MPTLMTHIVTGYPDLPTSEKIAETLIKSGTDFLELQIPFRDPIADGPVISEANQTSLDNGTTLEDSFSLLSRLRKKTKIPLFFMTYYNVPFVYGIEKFMSRASQVGVRGLIVPDIPFDSVDSDFFHHTAEKNNLSLIPVVSPQTPNSRLKIIAKKKSPLWYAVSGAGITGSAQEFNEKTAAYITRLRKFFTGKIALGFGVSSAEDIEKVSEMADVVVVGSQIIRLFQSGGIDEVEKFFSNL